MSYDSYRSFEASLEAAKLRRRVPNINKKVFHKVLHHVESHNRNREEQEMWKKHFSSRNEQKEEESLCDERYDEKRKRKKCKANHKKKKKKERKRESENKTDLSPSDKESAAIGPCLSEFYNPGISKWGHDGYHEMYDGGINSDSEDGKDKTSAKVKKKKKKKKKRKKAPSDSDCSSEEGVSKKMKKS